MKRKWDKVFPPAQLLVYVKLTGRDIKTFRPCLRVATQRDFVLRSTFVTFETSVDNTLSRSELLSRNGQNYHKRLRLCDRVRQPSFRSMQSNIVKPQHEILALLMRGKILWLVGVVFSHFWRRKKIFNTQESFTLPFSRDFLNSWRISRFHHGVFWVFCIALWNKNNKLHERKRRDHLVCFTWKTLSVEVLLRVK